VAIDGAVWVKTGSGWSSHDSEGETFMSFEELGVIR
jgi:hypothetical protein